MGDWRRHIRQNANNACRCPRSHQLSYQRWPRIGPERSHATSPWDFFMSSAQLRKNMPLLLTSESNKLLTLSHYRPDIAHDVAPSGGMLSPMSFSPTASASCSSTNTARFEISRSHVSSTPALVPSFLIDPVNVCLHYTMNLTDPPSVSVLLFGAGRNSHLLQLTADKYGICSCNFHDNELEAQLFIHILGGYCTSIPGTAHSIGCAQVGWCYDSHDAHVHSI